MNQANEPPPPNGREKPATQIVQLMQWLEQSQVTHLDLAIQRSQSGGGKRPFLAPCTTGAENLGPSSIEKRLAWLRAENAAGADTYFRPYRHKAWPLIFLDDLPPIMAAKIAAKYRAAVIKTSPGSCHLWLHMTKALDEVQRFEAQRELVNRLNGKADPGSVSGDHWGRLPGFRNRKPGRNCWVNLFTLSHGPSCHPPTVAQHSLNQSKNREACHPPEDQGVADIDHSRMEWGWVMGSLESGVCVREVLANLIERAQLRRGHTDGLRYAKRTVQKACRILGIPGP